MPRTTVRKCAGCRAVKPRDQFDTFTSANGRTMLMHNCRDCNDPAGSKACHRCGVTKPCLEYYRLVTIRLGLPTLDNTCKDCRNRYTRRWRLAQKVGQGRERDPDVPMNDNPKRPPGWTPPPSQSDLSQWYTDTLTRSREMERRRSWHGTEAQREARRRAQAVRDHLFYRPSQPEAQDRRRAG